MKEVTTSFNPLHIVCKQAKIHHQIQIRNKTCPSAKKLITKKYQNSYTGILPLHHRWEKVIIPEFENERLLIELEAKKRHQNEIEEFKESTKTDPAYKYHPSPHLLNLERQKEALKSSFIKEAFSVAKLTQGNKISPNLQELKKLKKIKNLKKTEKAKHNKEMSKKVNKKIRVLQDQHKKEIEALKYKKNILRENLKIEMAKELDVIKKRYTNMKKEIDNNYKKQMRKIKS